MSADPRPTWQPSCSHRGTRVKEGVAGPVTRAGGVGSQNTLAAQLGGEPGLHVPKSTNWNLLPRLLPRGPDWHAVAVVPCRLAKRAPLEPKAEPSGAGLSTKPSVSRQCGGEALRFPKPISARNSSTPQGPQALGSLAKGLGHPSLARPAKWVGWERPSWSLANWAWLFLFSVRKGRRACAPAPLRWAFAVHYCHQAELFCRSRQQLPVLP